MRSLTYLIASPVVTPGNGFKTTGTRNLHPSVTFDENWRSIRRQMRPQSPYICEGKKILYWVEDEILAVMGKYTLLILFLLFCFLFVFVLYFDCQ